MAREWKPGDVAMVQRPNADGERAAVYSVGGTWWLLGEGTWTARATPARPLVVIDPEDREQVLLTADWLNVHTKAFVTEDEVQAALRDLADPKPAKPEEPTGLGSMVLDRDDDTFVLAAFGWLRISSGEPDEVEFVRPLRWSDIDVVEVLR